MADEGQASAIPPYNVWDDWKRGVEFIRQRLQDYADRRLLRIEQLAPLQAHYQAAIEQADSLRASGATGFPETGLPDRARCNHCGAPVRLDGRYCPRCGMIQYDPLVDEVRYRKFLRNTGERLHRAGLIDLHQLHAIQTAVDQEIRKLDLELQAHRLNWMDLHRLRKASGVAVNEPPPLEFARPQAAWNAPQPEGGQPPVGQSAEQSTATQPPALPQPPVPRRNFLEVLLDPQSIQWLLASGGLLLVVGLVVYLASVGLFQNPVFVAILMAVGNLATLAGGWFLLLKTRYHLAGRAVTLLACMAMPLHLWFYHAQGIMTLDGHLWVPAAVICALYAASAWVLKDRLFVYVMMGGITLTGLLILVDLHKFGEIAAPSMLLMVLGLIAIHIERVFTPNSQSPFSRDKFGLAFFFSGQALVGGSLALLLGAQIVGWFWSPVFSQILTMPKPAITTESHLKLLALVIVSLSVYAWIYSTLVVRRKGVYAYLAAAALLWAQVLAVDLWSIDLTPHFLIGVLALTALPAVLGQKLLSEEHPLSRTLRTLGVLLVVIAACIAVIAHFRSTNGALGSVWPYQIGWASLLTVAMVCVVARLGAWVSLPQHPRTANWHFLASAAALLLVVAGGLSLSGLRAWHHQAPLLVLVPIGYLIASRLYGDRPSAKPVFFIAQAAMIVVMVSLLGSSAYVAQRVIEPVAGETLNLWLALIALEAAIFYALLATWGRKSYAFYLMTAMFCASMWQVFGYFNLPAGTFVNIYALIGVALLVVYRLAILDEAKQHGLSLAAFVCGNSLVALAVVVSVLMTLADLLGHRIGNQQLMLTSGIALICVIAALLTRATGWRRFHVLAVIVEAALAVICLHAKLNLSAWQNIELLMVGGGVILLITAHVQALRRRDALNDLVTLGLPLGSLLVCLPLAGAMLYFRFYDKHLSLHDEIGLITASIMLFASGVVLKFRATTLVGAAFGILHLLVLMVSVGMQAQLTIGLYLLIGGGVIFALGLILAICRERLLTLPARVRAREGVFKVLSWR